MRWKEAKTRTGAATGKERGGLPCSASRRKIGFSKEFADSIFIADTRRSSVQRFERPGYVERRIVPENRTFASRIVRIGGFVENLSGFRDNQKAMGETLRNPQKFEIVGKRLGFEVEARPFAEIGRIPPEIHGDIPDMAGEDADEFSLRLAKLVVKSAKHATDRKRLIVLHEVRRELLGGIGRFIENFCKPAATIAEAPGLNKLDVA